MIRHIPGIAPTVFIRPNTLPECFGARSEGFTAIALLWKPEPPIINARHNTALWKLFTFAAKRKTKKWTDLCDFVSILTIIVKVWNSALKY